MRTLVGILAVLAGIAICQSRIITVDDDGPADFAAIQAAIDDSNDGDTVLVADGTYTGDGNRDIDFHGKAITVKSENAPESCIIDCDGTPSEPHRGLYFHTFERQDSVLSGVTVKNGYADAGGGIYCSFSSPTITNCIIIANNAADYGGGLYCIDSSPIIENCRFIGNRAYGGTSEASKSYFGQPVCEPIVSGDINGDCLVDFLDFRIIALHWPGDAEVTDSNYRVENGPDLCVVSSRLLYAGARINGNRRRYTMRL